MVIKSGGDQFGSRLEQRLESPLQSQGMGGYVVGQLNPPNWVGRFDCENTQSGLHKENAREPEPQL